MSIKFCAKKVYLYKASILTLDLIDDLQENEKRSPD